MRHSIRFSRFPRLGSAAAQGFILLALQPVVKNFFQKLEKFFRAFLNCLSTAFRSASEYYTLHSAEWGHILILATFDLRPEHKAISKPL